MLHLSRRGDSEALLCGLVSFLLGHGSYFFEAETLSIHQK
jgi:hypothetical protein